MTIQVLMPALSPTMTEGTLARWLKKEGDEIAPGDAIAEVETDKATMEVEAVEEGTLGRILVGEGTEGVPVNTPIAVLLEEGEDASALDQAAAEPSAPGPEAAPAEAKAPAEPKREPSGAAPPPPGAPPPLCYSSVWLSMNVLSLDEKTVCVEASEGPQMDQLDRLGFEVIPVPFRDAYPFGGGLHCATADVWREGDRGDWFPHAA